MSNEKDNGGSRLFPGAYGKLLFEDYDGAINDVRLDIDENGDSIPAYGIWGDALREKKQYDEAIEKYKTGLKVSTRDGKEDFDKEWQARCHVGVGRALHEKGENEKALESFVEAESLHSGAVEKFNAYKDQLLAEVGAGVNKTLNKHIGGKLAAYDNDAEEFHCQYKQLKEESDEWQKKFMSSLCCLSIMSIVAVAGAALMCWWTKSYTEPLGVISWLAAAGMALVPFVWRARMLDARRHEALTLAYGFLRKAVIEERIFTFSGSDEKMRKELLQLYVKHWMEKSPLEVLLALRRKGGGGGFAMPVQRMMNKIVSGDDIT